MKLSGSSVNGGSCDKQNHLLNDLYDVVKGKGVVCVCGVRVVRQEDRKDTVASYVIRPIHTGRRIAVKHMVKSGGGGGVCVWSEKRRPELHHERGSRRVEVKQRDSVLAGNKSYTVYRIHHKEAAPSISYSMKREREARVWSIY